MMPRFDPHESLGFHCNLTLKAFLCAWERKLKGTGVSPTQIQALAHIVASGPLSQSELVKRLSITPASGVRLVDRMVRDASAHADEDRGILLKLEIPPCDEPAG